MAEPWAVGLLFSRTGVTGYVEETQLKASLLAIDEINGAGGVRGRPIQPVIRDPGSEPDGFRREADHLLCEAGVTVVFGCCTSRCRKAVLPLVERANALLFYSAIYEGFEYSPNVIYTGASPNQSAIQLARYLTRHHGRRFVFVGSDYVFPRESNRVMRELVEAAGGTVLDETYLDIHTGPEPFEGVGRRARRLGAEVIFSTVVGASTAYLYDACARLAPGPGRPVIASLTTSEAETGLMQPGSAAGHVTACPYFESVATPQNAAFVAAYRARYGPASRTNMTAEAAYFQMHLFAAGLAEAGSLRPEALTAVLLGTGLAAPQGDVLIDPDNNHTYLRPRIGRARPDGGFDVVEEAPGLVKPDPYLISYGYA
ncbi:Aliphatic amidase expression-regulating protein [Methylobacterium crusticola]|uniref:Aliphatic amidase expression-regulating protein n=1 Tax=Methylobacterium crusticola TaxID=1697972 RepID=A0ABQ4R3F3_9HYPH|nr:transporter substrate-binding domain-containing protein [Methylobacterium crusticola]GJD52208.1 Aliphatic amidase expression-regulating protein [Methylobacterium crusticola]